MPAQSQAKRRSAPQPEEKPAKRTRISRACDQCRLAREKCDGVQPTCSTCSGASRQCSYTANPKKRGIQPGYIRTLELALAWLFQQNAENEAILNEKLAKEGTASLLLSRDSKESNKLHRRWRKAKFYMNVDKQLSGGEASRHEQPDYLSQSSDEASDAEETPVAKAGHHKKHSVHEPASAAVSQLQQPPRTPQGHASALMPADSYKLFDVYFTYVQSWLPICEKHDVLKSAYSYPLQGLPTTSEQPDSGSFAELWSILAVASLYATSTNSETPPGNTLTMAANSYENAKSMIPSELGHFEPGHIKALLNLAVFNMTQAQTGAAWLLIGCASRALEIMDQSILLTNPRHKHIQYGCFLLESMTALQLNRRAHVRRDHLSHLGAIDENGLEEWQPWSGFGDASPDGRRTPLLALSTFNNVLELVDILVSVHEATTSPHEEAFSERLDRWKAHLPAQLACVNIESPLPLLTPPLALLQATYHVACFASKPSNVRLQRLLDILEQCCQQFGLGRIPPPIKCLLEFVHREAPYPALDGGANHTRLQKLREKILTEWPRRHVPKERQTQERSTLMPFRDQRNALRAVNPNTQPTTQLPTTSSPHLFFPSPHHSTLSPLLIQPSPSQQPAAPFQSEPAPANSLETFFDELASLDRATRPDNQPQFMQNLGFGPDASMADLFSEFIPVQSSEFATGDDVASPVQFDQYSFYDGG
ncbi:quinic acid utilization activator [Pyrenophora seminiperda CCB06]|uniref:Quinic acid utilization activator n=1 Tax=Pyrenophora seminiperda CCB06 TaxID=1302712 RepID=A0A3M7MEA4_9PLEO|nr:quinic acid utilization activator [Pyrenophora seminiperda CCB06]